MTTFWRLLGFLRPYRRGVALSLLLAAAAMGTGVAIPFLVGRAVDAVRRGEPDLWPVAGVIVAAGVGRLVFSVLRRLVAGRVPPGVEPDLRNPLYSHLHAPEPGFLLPQQTRPLIFPA